VGSALVLLGKRAGCRVVGVVGRTDKVASARALGCDVVIDKTREDLWRAARAAAPTGYDVVLDANGASTLRESYEHLGSPGRLVVYGFHSMLATHGGRPNPLRLALSWLRTPRFDPLRMTGENRSVLAFNLSYLFERRELLEHAMRELLTAVADRTLVLPEVHVYGLRDVAEAHRALESGRTVGKLVLVPDAPSEVRATS
jgi:NADPH:quinone reductase-like Zn-dependent oxidoreductase